MNADRPSLTGSAVLRALTPAIAPAMREAGCTRQKWTLGFSRRASNDWFALCVGLSRPWPVSASFVVINVDIGLARIEDARAGRYRRLSRVLGPGAERSALLAYRNAEIAAARVRDAAHVDDRHAMPNASLYRPIADDLPENYYADVWLPVATPDAAALVPLLPKLLIAALDRVADARVDGSRLLLDGE